MAVLGTKRLLLHARDHTYVLPLRVPLFTACGDGSEGIKRTDVGGVCAYTGWRRISSTRRCGTARCCRLRCVSPESACTPSATRSRRLGLTLTSPWGRAGHWERGFGHSEEAEAQVRTAEPQAVALAPPPPRAPPPELYSLSSICLYDIYHIRLSPFAIAPPLVPPNLASRFLLWQGVA